MRYIELNPVRAGLATTPSAYRWTSYRAHAMGDPDVLLADHPIYLGLGDTPAERSRIWRAFCAEGAAEAGDPRKGQNGVRTGSDPHTTPV